MSKEPNAIPKNAIKPPPPPSPPPLPKSELIITHKSPADSQQRRSIFKVIDNRTGKEIRGTFVLLPEHDSAARTALAAYAEATNKPKIARWISAWLMNIHRKRLKSH